MSTPESELKTRIVGMIGAAADIAVASRKAVKDVVLGGLKDASELAAHTAILAGSVKASVIGLAESGKETMEGVRGAAGGAIQASAEVGGDLAQAAAAALRGALAAASELGEDARHVTQQSAAGMLDAAGDLGEQAVQSVRRGLVELASVPRDVVEAAERDATGTGE